MRQSLPKMDNLVGTLAHRIAQEIFQPGAPPEPMAVETIAARRFDELLPRIAATLLLPGAAGELAAAKRSIPQALAELARFLRSENLTVVGVEYEFPAPDTRTDTLAAGTGANGRIDLLARAPQGRLVVIDLKWQRSESRRRAELKNGVALQIAVYARHVADGQAEPATGFFMLRQKRFLTNTPLSGGMATLDRRSHAQGDMGQDRRAVRIRVRRNRKRQGPRNVRADRPDAGGILGPLSPRPAQVRLLRLCRHLRREHMSSTDGSHKVGIVTASAGTGKTYDLTSRIEAEIGAGRAPERVLARTFTVKAAEELRERARERLISKGDAENAVRLLGARIGTINGVCGGLVKEFAFGLGLSPIVDIVDENAAKATFRKASDAAIGAYADELGPPRRFSAMGELPRDRRDWRDDVTRSSNSRAPTTSTRARLRPARNAPSPASRSWFLRLFPVRRGRASMPDCAKH